MKNIRTSKNLFVFADKSNNLYEMSKENYNKLHRDNITKTYKKTNTNIKDNIDKEAANIAKSFHIQDRVERYANRNAFLNLKNHK